MTDADLNEAIKTAWYVVQNMSPARTSGKHIQEAEDHLADLMEAQRRRAQDHGEACCESDDGQLQKAKEEISELKDTIDCQDLQLKEAKEAAARADKMAEGLYKDLLRYKDWPMNGSMKIRKQEQQLQTQSNTIAKQDDRIKRMSEYIRAKDLRIERLRRKVADLLGVDVQDLVDSDEGLDL